MWRLLEQHASTSADPELIEAASICQEPPIVTGPLGPIRISCSPADVQLKRTWTCQGQPAWSPSACAPLQRVRIAPSRRWCCRDCPRRERGEDGLRLQAAAHVRGQTTVTIPPGVRVVSDPADLDIAPLGRVAVSLYLPEQTPVSTFHWEVALNCLYWIRQSRHSRQYRGHGNTRFPRLPERHSCECKGCAHGRRPG